MNRKENLWIALRSLWMKYCGIADEYKMLRDRWLYLYDKKHPPVLPYLKRKLPTDEKLTFDMLDDHIKRINKLFKKNFGLTREKIEKFDTTKDDRKTSLEYFSKIKDHFFELSTYAGLLKLAFFQRTVSSEISHVASGVPHSPERTIGNELFYLAADNIAKRYYECLRIPKAKWDGFITFAPPITQGHFYGAFYKPSPSLQLFHISMSEEQKYFVGAYLAMAHEFGHAAIKMAIDRFFKLWQIVYPRTYEAQIKFLENYRATALPDSVTLDKWSRKRCATCEYYPSIGFLHETFELFEEVLADLISLKISGVNSSEQFLDEVFENLYLPQEVISARGKRIQLIPILRDTLIRLSAQSEYAKAQQFHTRIFDFRVDGMLNRGIDYVNKVFKEVERKRHIKFDHEEMVLSFMCQHCYINLGKLWGEAIHNFEMECYNRNVESPFSEVITDKFKIRKNVGQRIIKNLSKGIPCIKDDPRNILHAYYEAFKKSHGKQRPNYIATIHSLAFNKWRRK